MAVGRESISTGRAKRGGALNIITGNTISRNESNGQFFVIKSSNSERVSRKGAAHKGDAKAKNSNKSNQGGFTINQKKAEQAEQAVLSYLNKSDN